MAKWYKAGTGIAVNGDSISCTGAAGNSWRTAYGSKEITSGQHSWKLKITKTQNNIIMIGIASTTKYLESWHHGRNDGADHCYFYYGYNGYIHDKQTSEAYSEIFTLNDEIGVSVDLDKQTLCFTKNGRNLGNAVTNIHKNAKYRLTVQLYSKDDEVQWLSEEQKEETKEEYNHYISKSTEYIIKEYNYLYNELSSNKIQSLDVKGLSATSKYFGQLHKDINKLKIELAKCESQLSQKENILKQRMSVDVNNYKNWNTSQIELYINGLENGRYSKYVSKLLQNFASDGVTACNLPELDQGILRQFGVTNFADCRDLQKQFNKLGQGNEGGKTYYK